MFLFKARGKAEAEFQRALEEAGVTREQCEAFLAKNPRFAHAQHRAPHVWAGSAADVVAEIAPYITQSRVERARARARRGVASFAGWGRRAIEGARSMYARREELSARLRDDAELAIEALRGREEVWAPILADLAGRALAREAERHEAAPVVTTSANRKRLAVV
jgi:hypothetical protein